MAAGAEIVGVSRDTAQSHANFQKELSLPFALLADTDEKLCNAFGTLVEKEHEGKKFMGVQRSTFLIDKNGIIQKVWPKVDVTGHAAAVLVELVQLTKA